MTYILGAAVCLSGFVLGVAVLRPAGVTLAGKELAPALSLMMTEVIGPWAKNAFYIGVWAAMVSTLIGIFDGASRLYVQPLRHNVPGLFEKLPYAVWQKILMTLDDGRLRMGLHAGSRGFEIDHLDGRHRRTAWSAS